MPTATGVRLLLKFNFGQQIRFCGWTESYDLGFADLPTAVAKRNSIQQFMSDRAFCLGSGPLLVEATLSAWVQPLAPGASPVRRNTLSLAVPQYPAGDGGLYNKAFTGLDNPYADFAVTVYYINMQTNLSSAPVYRRNCWIAGLPDVSDQTNSPVILSGPVLTAITIFLKDLANVDGTAGAACGISIRSIDRSGANAIKPCTAWNLGANTYTVPGHGFVVNQPILAEGMKTRVGGISPKGRYLVSNVVDVNTIALAGSLAPTPPVKTGGFRAAIYTFNQCTSAVGEGFSKRNKGRPSGLSVGRRRSPTTSRA